MSRAFRSAIPFLTVALLAGLTRTAAASATSSVPVRDMSMNGITAYTLTVPARWHATGILEPGNGVGKCGSFPVGVWRATSPDGLSMVEAMPTLSWVYGTGPVLTKSTQTGCLSLHGAMSAQNLLRYVANTLRVHCASDDPIPAANAKAQQQLRDADAKTAASWASERIQAPKRTVQLAQANVTSANGSFAMKGRLWVQMSCTETHFPGMKSILRGMADQAPSDVTQCDANVVYYSAPAAQYPTVIAEWSAPGMGANFNPAWQNAYVLNTIRVTAETQQQNFEQTMALQQRMHQQFLDQMQHTTNVSMARAQDAMNARTAAASDWVDYALDQQTVVDPSTGQMGKVSNQAVTAWTNGSGGIFASKNPLANPNGFYPGTWTQQPFSHGNGTPK
jgi:hypothetical protein